MLLICLLSFCFPRLDFVFSDLERVKQFPHSGFVLHARLFNGLFDSSSFLEPERVDLIAEALIVRELFFEACHLGCKLLVKRHMLLDLTEQQLLLLFVRELQLLELVFPVLTHHFMLVLHFALESGHLLTELLRDLVGPGFVLLLLFLVNLT